MNIVRVEPSAWEEWPKWSRRGPVRRHVGWAGPRRLLDGEEVRELRRRRSEGWRIDELGPVYGISRRTVHRYLKPEYIDRDRTVIEDTVLVWERRYALNLRPQEREALVEELAHRLAVQGAAA